MPKLIVKRTSEWNNNMRDIGIYLNDKKIGVVENGQTKAFEVAPGKHRLRGKIDWCGSETLDIELIEEENLKIELSGFRLGKWLMPFVLLACAFYFIFSTQLNLNSEFLAAIIAPPLLFLVYHLTLGRNKYLVLKKI